LKILLWARIRFYGFHTDYNSTHKCSCFSPSKGKDGKKHMKPSY
jgi:hypothetical protein